VSVTDLTVTDLTVEYVSGGYAVRPLDRLSLSAASGELVLLLGPSGCGKTTLLSALAGILTPSAGSIRVGGQDVTGLRNGALTHYRRHTVGIVFQAFNLIPSLTAGENVAAPLWAAGVGRRAARDRAEALLESVGLADRVRHRPGDLSGGQQQRVAIARALVHDPPLLLADEPTAHLDYIQVDSVVRTLRSLAAPGRLVVVATHDERMVTLADRVVRLAGSLPEVASPQTVDLGAGEVVFEQGSTGSLVYVVERGSVDIVRTRADGTEEALGRLGPGEYFGELGPMMGRPRAATARAHAATTLTGYSVRDFRAWLAEGGPARPTARSARRARPRAGRSRAGRSRAGTGTGTGIG
jgi:putative ABC transport system ATP-binding protein